MTVSLHKAHIEPSGEPAAALSAQSNIEICIAWMKCETRTDPYALSRRVHQSHLDRMTGHGRTYA